MENSCQHAQQYIREVAIGIRQKVTPIWS